MCKNLRRLAKDQTRGIDLISIKKIEGKIFELFMLHDFSFFGELQMDLQQKSKAKALKRRFLFGRSVYLRFMSGFQCCS